MVDFVTRSSRFRAVLPTPAGVGGSVVARIVTPDYFRVLQIRILEGRNFTEAERSSKGSLVILSKDLAARLFAGEKPHWKAHRALGIRPYRVAGPVYTVVGVAANVKNGGLAGEDAPGVYEL